MTNPLPLFATTAPVLTGWWRRVLATLIDGALGWVVFGAVTGVEHVLGGWNHTAFGDVVIVVVLIGYVVWNHGYRQGTTGSSLGKQALGIRIVGARDGQPVGFEMSVVRQLCHVLDSAVFCIGYLMPLFDAHRRTFADMIMETLAVVRVRR